MPTPDTALGTLFDAGCSPATNALIRRLRDDRLEHELAYASSKLAERDLDRRSEPRAPRYSNIEPNSGLRRHGEI